MPCSVHFHPGSVIALVGVAILVAILVAVYSASGIHSGHGRVPIYVYDDAGPNAQLVVSCRIGNWSMPFQMDTGYSGAPLVSGTFLSSTPSSGSPLERYEHALRHRSTRSSLSDFVAKEQCSTYSGGCKTTVQTASGVSDSHSRLWMCGCIQMQTEDGHFSCVRRRSADVLVAKEDAPCHLLSFDYMRDVSPSVLWMRDKVWEVCRGVRATWLRSVFHIEKMHLHNGVPCISAMVAGSLRRLILDTGGGFAILLNRSHSSGIALTGKKVHHWSVGGGGFCGELGEASVHVSRTTFDSVPVVVSSKTMSGVDGLVGLGLLRCLDIYIGHKHIGMRVNGQIPLQMSAYSDAQHGKC